MRPVCIVDEPGRIRTHATPYRDASRTLCGLTVTDDWHPGGISLSGLQITCRQCKVRHHLEPDVRRLT